MQGSNGHVAKKYVPMGYKLNIEKDMSFIKLVIIMDNVKIGF
jgi:hypothetical protein